MGRSSDEQLKAQAEAAQEATPGEAATGEVVDSRGSRSWRVGLGWTLRAVGAATLVAGILYVAAIPILVGTGFLVAGGLVLRREGGGELSILYGSLPSVARVILPLLLAVAAAMLPFIWHQTLGIESAYWLNIADKILIAALLALGLNVVVGFAGLLDLGYVAFFAVGAYTYALLSGAARYSVLIEAQTPEATALALKIKPNWHMYFWLFFFIALIIAMLAGLILGAPTLRLRGDYLAIVTLGFGEIVRVTANNLHSTLGGPRGVFNLPHPAIGGFGFSLKNEPYFWLLLGLIVIWIFLLIRLNRSRVGRAWAAVREDELAAAATGVPTVRVKLWAFAIGAAVASFGGMVYASKINFINPDAFRLFPGDFASVTVLAMVVLGGMGGIAGPIVGAALLVFLPEYFRAVGDARFMLYGLALVVVMILRPQGLIPSRRRAAELKGEVRETSVFEAREHGAT